MPTNISIAEDIRQDIEKSLTRDKLQEAEVKVLKKMDEIKNRETQQGKSPAKGGRWNNRYNKQYAKREKNNRRSPVTLRNGKDRIEQTFVVERKTASELKFNTRIGRVFYLHNEGEARGGKYRQIYPNSDAEVPDSLDAVAENAVFRLLQ